MRYLYNFDYEQIIQNRDLLEITSLDNNILLNAENTAIEELKSHLIQKYNFALEMQDLILYVPINTQLAGTRVYLDANAWTAGTYNLNNLVVYNKQVYRCLATTTSTPIYANFWELLGNQKQVFNFIYPRPLFELDKYYVVGDLVFYENKNYTCIQNSINNFPTNTAFFADNGSYTVPANSLLNTTYTEAKDNRCMQFVYYICVLSLFNLKRIAPKNIPLWIEKEYERALEWCNNAKLGNITISLPLYSPKSGKRIKIGSNNFKNINSF